MSEMRTWKVTVTAVITADTDPGLWPLDTVLKDIEDDWNPTGTVELETIELVEDVDGRIAALEALVERMRSDNQDMARKVCDKQDDIGRLKAQLAAEEGNDSTTG